MKRSIQVSAPFLAAMALAISTGCRKPQMQRCVDEHNHVVDPSFCKNLPQNPNQQNYQPGFYPMYRYYYGGYGGYGIGSTATGGGYIPMSGQSYSTTSGVSSGTTRGGFGSSFGGGDSSGGAHGASSGQ